jgi:ketosteroid isomerase-like protein
MNFHIERIANGLLLTALVCVCGCASSGKINDAVQPASGLLKADREFARYAEDHGVANAFALFAAPNATSLPMGDAPLLGRDAIVKSMQNFPAGQLKWFPVAADIASSGDLGYTWGRYEFHTRDADGKPETHHGKYVTVWKKQANGSWKYVVDIGNNNPPPTQSATTAN